MFFSDCQVISVKKLQLVSRLHVYEQSWFKTAEHCILYLTSKVTMQFLLVHIFRITHGKNTKRHRLPFVSIPDDSVRPWLWQWPSCCRTQRTWISSRSVLTTGNSSWLLSCPRWRRLSMLSLKRSVSSSKASPSGSSSAPHRGSKGKLKYQRWWLNLQWLSIIM